MNRKTIAAIIAIIAALIIIGVWYTLQKRTTTPAMTMNTSTNTTPSSNTSGNNNTNTGGNVNQSASSTVTISNFAFTPNALTVREGTKVTWKNDDSVPHTVTEVDGQDGPNSGMLNPGSTYSFTFTKAGTYHYHCSIHTDMEGTITVTSAT